MLLLIILRSAAILAPPSISENEPVLDATIAECDNSAAEDFLPRKREKGQSIWFDVPIRGGIGMIHVSKRKCPEIMFRYLDHLSKVEGRKGWSFVSKEDGPLMSPAKVTWFCFFPSLAKYFYVYFSHALSLQCCSGRSCVTCFSAAA